MKRTRIIFLIFVFLQIFSFAFGAPIVIYGDSRHNHSIHRKVVSAILKVRPAVVFHLGDFVDRGSSSNDWQAFKEITSKLLKSAEFFPVLGNHEQGSALFFKNFNLANNQSWYSVERQGIHFTILDSTHGLSPNSPQYRWLESDLSSIKDNVRFRIVLLHHPILSVGGHNIGRKNLKFLLPLFKRYRICAVFCGHEHNYQRFLQNNIYYIDTGGGGAPLYSQTRSSPYLQKFVKDYHFCALLLKDGTLNVKVFDTNLNLIDEFKIPSPSSK